MPRFLSSVKIPAVSEVPGASLETQTGSQEVVGCLRSFIEFWCFVLTPRLWESC